MNKRNKQKNASLIANTVSSRKGMIWIILMVSIGMGLVMAAYNIKTFLSGGNVSLQEFLVTLAMVVFFMWLVLTYSTLKVKVSKEGILFDSFWGERALAWKEVYSISVIPGYGYIPFIGYNVLLHTTTSRRGVPLSTIMFGNSHRVMKAIIEAAYRGNPGISIKGSLLDTYGLPPYGIFKLEK